MDKRGECLLNDPKVFLLHLRSMIYYSSIFSIQSILLNFYQASHVSLIANEIYQQSAEKNDSYQQSPEKMKNNSEHKRQYEHFSLLSSFTNAIDLYT